MNIDIQNNRANILKHNIKANPTKWQGVAVELQMDGDYSRIMYRLIEYLKQTAMVVPYADITYVDPRGRLYKFETRNNEDAAVCLNQCFPTPTASMWRR